ncbi:MAG: acetyl xylan esterase [Paenibacillus sp.]|nr:acetyl xylan esterase [Paenibacillus sp.]
MAGRPLPQFSSQQQFEQWRAERRSVFQRMLGIDRYLQQERTPLNIRVTGTVDCDTFRIDKLVYESLPGLFVAAHLYMPKQLPEPAPAILYVCGHHRDQKINYQDHPRKFAQLGFVTLIVDTVQLGEVFGEHHGTYSKGRFDWVSRGYTPAAAEVWNGIRGLDLLSGLNEVDPQRLGVTGHSGGGSISWWMMCADDRVKAIAASSGTGHEASHIEDRTLDSHCDCNFPNNPYGWSLIEQYALAAPRPVLIVAPEADQVFRIDSVRDVYAALKSLYDNIGAADQLRLFSFMAPHMYSPESRNEIFSWFVRHLSSVPLTPEQIGDIDGVRLPKEQLLVFGEQPPLDDRSLTVHDWLLPLHAEPLPETKEGLAEYRSKLIARLRQDSFAAFPHGLPPAQAAYGQRSLLDLQGRWIQQFSFESEPGWRLRGEIRGHAPELDRAGEHPLRPAAICLRMPGDAKGSRSYELLASDEADGLKARIDVRGTGDTAWGAELNWHLRRAAALIGTTITALRVWDALRGIEAVRGLPGVDPDRVTLAGSGEMAVVAIFAALLDGRVASVIVEHCPATLTAPDDANPGIVHKELINALRHTDLPQAAACLWPAQLHLVGSSPDDFAQTKHVYDRLGQPGNLVFR